MHGSEHAGDELVDTVALLNERYKGGDSALIVPHVAEVRENQLLELLDLVLQHHEVADGLVTLVGVVDGLQAQVLLVLEGTVELGVLMVEGELGEEVVNVFADQGTVTTHAFTSSAHSAVQALDPTPVGHCLFQSAGVALLQDLMNGDEGLECLNFVGEDRLAVEQVKSTREVMMEGGCETYTLMPDQKAAEDR